MTLRYSQIIPAAVLLILAVVGILLLELPSKEMETPPEHMYGIVLDAGSSHTSMFIYKWPAGKENDTGIVTEHSQCHAEGRGISSYAGVRGGAAKSLKSCLDKAVKDIPKSRHNQTPLYLGATAGMRLLKIDNATETERILKEVENKLRSYPFNFKEATILSGQHEGAYGWVTVNYLQENFAKYGFAGRWLNPGRKTTGALDLGGASTQITFQTSDKVEEGDNMMELKLYGQSYRLYTQSFLCYGQDQFLRKLLAFLIKTQGVKPQVVHPCYPQQFKMSIKLGKDVFDSPCTKSDKPEKFDPQMSVTVVGTGDYQSCQAAVRKMFSFDNCSYSKCSFDGIFQPSLKGNFMTLLKIPHVLLSHHGRNFLLKDDLLRQHISPGLVPLAFSAFFFTVRNLFSLNNITTASPSKMEAAVQYVCNLTISEITEKTKQPEKYMKNMCVISLFIKVLLTQGYRFDELSLPSISFQEKVEGASVGWSLGCMLNLSNTVPAESLSLMKALPPGPWAGILFLFIALLLFALGYLLFSLFNTINKEGPL